MRKLLAAAFFALSVANANSQALSVSPNGGIPGGATLTVQYNNAGVFGGMSGTSWDDANRSLTITGVTVTTSHPVLELSQTWGAVTAFTGVKFNAITGTSTTGSLLLDLQADGLTKFNVRKDGRVVAQFDIFTVSGSLNIFNNTGNVILGASSDTIIGRAAAASLRLGNADAAAPIAQTLGVQNVVAGTSNTAGVLWTQKGSAGTGTGVGGNITWQVALAGSTGTAQNSFTDALTIDASAAVPRIAAGGPVKLKSYTVAGLPTGSEGDEAYVTDQLTACPALGGAFTGGGVVKCKAFYDGTSWNHQ